MPSTVLILMVANPPWYHFGMAMTLRLPDDADQRLEKLAEERNTSKHALLVEATKSYLNAQDEQRRVDRAVDRVYYRYGKVMERLADA